MNRRRMRRHDLAIVWMAVLAALAGWADRGWAASAATKPAFPVAPATQSATTKPSAPGRPMSRPAGISAKELEELRRRARASTQQNEAATKPAPAAPAPAAPAPKPAPVAKPVEKPKPEPVAAPPQAPPTPVTPNPEDPANRFKRARSAARDKAKPAPALPATEPAEAAKPKIVKTHADLPKQPAKPRPEDRKYMFSFQGATWQEVLDTFCRMSGLTLMGEYPRTTSKEGITYLSPRELTYHEAMHELNMLLMDNMPSYWLVREEFHLRIRRLSDWPRYVPADRRYNDVDAFDKADLSDDDWAMLFHTPASQEVGELITNILATMPDNVLRVSPVGETSRLKITGICFYIRQFLTLADSPMFLPESRDTAKLRKIKFYKIERASAASVQRVLETIVLPPRRRGIGTTVDEADRVEMVLETMTNTIIVKAKEEHHSEIKEMIDRIEKEELVADAKTEFIKLEHARAQDLAMILNPLLMEQSRMKPSFDRQKAERERVYLQAHPSSNSLIVLAAKEGLEKVQKLIKQLDVETPEAMYKRIDLKNGRAEQIYPVVNSIAQSRQGGRMQRGAVGQQLQVIPDPQGNALFILGEPKDIEYVEKVVTEIDKADTERTKAHIVKLKKASPQVVAQGLQALFGAQATGRRRGPIGTFQALPDERSKVLVVICLEKDWKEIEPQIKEFDDQSISLDPVMRTIPIENGDAEEIAQTLNNALRGRIGRMEVIVGADRKTNMLFVTTQETAFEEVKSLIDKLDVPSGEGQLEVFPLKNASAPEVATLLQQMFMPQRGSGRRVSATPPQIIPDQISNSLIVRASKTDLPEIELQAARLDDAAAGDGDKPIIVSLEYAEPGQVANLCQALFMPQGGGRRGGPQTTFFMPMRTGLVVKAPSQKMPEIQAFIKSVDSPEAENVEVKTVQLPGQDVQELAATLERVFAADRRRGAAGSMTFMPNPSAGLLVIIAPKKRFEEIDKIVNQYSEGAKLGMASMKMFELKHARVDDVAELLNEMLGAKLGRGRRGGTQQVQVLREPRQNKLIVFATEDVLKQADDMVKQLDVPIGDEGAGVQWIELKNADAGHVANTLQQMWSEKMRSGRQKFRAMPVRIWPETITNSVLVNAPADEFKEIQKLANELDQKVLVSTTQPTIIPVRYVQPSYIISMCEQMFQPQLAEGVGRRGRAGAQSMSFVAMQDGVMVRAPQSLMKDIQEFIKRLDSPGEAKITVKRFQLKNMDVNTLHTTLTQVFSKVRLERDEPPPGFVVDQPNETVTVTCWTSRLPDIEKVVEDFKAAEGQKVASVRELVDVKFTIASYAASTLEGMVKRQLGDRATRLGSRLQFGYEDRQNKVEIIAPPDVLDMAKKLLAEIDVRLPGATTQEAGRDLQVVQWIPLENVDAGTAASTVNQIWEASQPRQQRADNRPPVRIWAESISNSLLVAGAYGKDFETIAKIARDIDEKAIENPNKPIFFKLEYVTPSEVASMVSALFVPPSRRAQSKVMITTVSGGVIVRAPKVELKEIQEFIQTYDKPDATGLKIRTYYLPQTNVSELASTLNQIFGYKKRRRDEPGWNFIPNTGSDMLMVLAPEARLKEIEEVIKEYETNVEKTASKMQMFDLKFTRADYVSGTLNTLLREKLRRTRGERAVNQLQISDEPRQNKIVVFGPDDVMKQVEEMIKQIDIELPDEGERVKWIEIVNADASEVASTVEQLFRQERRRKQQDSATIQEVRIWPERVTNSVLVSAPKKEFEEIEKLAKKIDDEYALKGIERVKITPKFISVAQIESMIQRLFYSRSRRRDVRSEREQVRVIPAGAYSCFLEGPKDKLTEIKKMIEEMDTEGENAPIIKTYKMGDADVRQLARALSQTMGGVGSYIPEPRRGALIVSAPEHQFARIEKALEQLKAEIQEEEAQFEVLTLKHARPSEVYSRLSQLVTMQIGQRRSRRDESVMLSMLPDDGNSRLFVHAGAEELALVKTMLAELDQPGLSTEAVLHTIPLRYTDCNYMAGQIQQVFTPDELQRRAARHGRASGTVIPIRVVPDPATNSLLITCTEDAFRDVELFVAQREDAYTDKGKVLEQITPKYVNQGQLMAAINAIYNPPADRYGKRQTPFVEIRAIPASGSSFFLEAPKDKMPELKKLIADLDVEDKNQPIVRTYKLGDAVNVTTLTRMLQTTLSGKGTFYADPQLGMVIVTAPEHRFEQINKTMVQLKADIEEVRQEFKVFPLKFAKVNNIYGQVVGLVQTRASARRGRRGMGVQLSIVPDPALNRLFVYAGDEEMKLVEEMLKQFDIEGIEPEQQIYEIELANADASWAHSMVAQMFTQQELERRRRGQVGAVVQPIRVVPDTASNRLLIWASPQDYKDVEKFVKDLDERAKDTKPERRILEPKFIRANELYGMIQTLFLSQRQRTGQRSRYIETFMVMSGADIILNGPKDRLDEIEAFVATVDTEERAKMEIKTYQLPEVDINALVSTLNQLYGRDARQQRGNMLFIPDPQNNELMVSAPKSLIKDIEEIIVKKQEGAALRTRKLTIVEIKNADANYLASMLQPLIVERSRSRRGRYAQPEVTITPESRTNRLLIMAADAETKIAMELIAELDTEALGLKGQVRTIELKKADVSYVASTLQSMFSGRAQLRKSRTYTATPVYVVAEPMTNRIFVAASDADFKEIEKLAMEMDEAAELKGVQREKIEIKYANPGQLVGVINEMFRPLQRTGRRQPSEEVRLSVVGPNIVAQAPATKMLEIKQWIKELDVEEFAEAQTKFYQLEIARAQEVQGIIQPMLSAQAREMQLRQGQRTRRGGELLVVPDVRNNRLIITAPSQLLTTAEMLIKELDVEDPIWTGETVEIVELEKAEATQVAQVLQEILRDREGSPTARPRRDGAQRVSALAVTIVPDASSNTLILKGLPRELDRVKELIADLEDKAVAGSMQFKRYILEESDAEEMATVIQNVVNQAGGPRSRRNPVQVSTDWMRNAVFVAGNVQQQALVKKIIEVYEQPEYEIDPNTGEQVEKVSAPFEFIRLKYSDAIDIQYDLESLLKKQFGDKGPVLETLWGDSSVLMVSGKPNQIAAVRKLVDMFEEKNKSKPPVTRTMDIGMLAGEELIKQLEAWGYVDRKAGDEVKLIGARKKEDLIQEIDVDDGIRRRREAEEEEAKGDKLIERRVPARVWRRGDADRRPRFVPTSLLSELAAELNGIVVGASVGKAPTTAPTKPAAEPGAVKALPKTDASSANRFAKKQTPSPKQEDVPPKPEVTRAATDRGEPTSRDRATGLLDVLGKGDEGGEGPRVEIMIDEDSRSIVIKGPERKVGEIEDLIYRLQDQLSLPAGKDIEYRVYKPRHIDVNVAAALLERIFNEPRAAVAQPKKEAAKKGEKKEDEKEDRADMAQLRDMMRGRGVTAGAGRIRVIADTRTGYIICVAKPELQREIQLLMGKIDVPGLPPGNIRYFQLVNLNVEEVEAGLKAVLKLDRRRAPALPALPKGQDQAIAALQQQIQQLQTAGGATTFTSEQVTLASNASTNTLIVMAPDEVMQIVEDFIATMEDEAGAIEIEAVTLETAQASNVAQTMTGLYSRQVGAANGKGPGRGGRILMFTPDTESNTVYVRGPKDLRAEAIERIKQIDEKAGEEGKPFQIPLEHADAEVLAPKLMQAFATKLRKGKQSVQIIGDNASDTLIVRAPENLRDQIEKLAKALDVATVDFDIRVFPLEHANAVEVHEQMVQMTMQVFAQLSRGGKKNMKMDVFAAVPDPRTNSLIVSGGPTTFAIVEQIKQSIDVPPTAKSEQVTVVYQLEQAQASDVARAIAELYKSKRGLKYLKGGLEPPVADFDTTTNTVIIRATDPQQKQIKAEIIDKLEEFSRAQKIKDTTIVLKNADADEVAEMLTAYFTQRGAGRRQLRMRITPADIVTIVAEPNSNSLLVRCNDENLETIRKLVETLDVPGMTGDVITVVSLEHIDAAEAQTIMEGYLRRPGRGRQAELSGNIRLTASDTMNALIISGKKEIVSQIEAKVKGLDQPSVAADMAPKIIPLKAAQATMLASVLTQLFTEPARTMAGRRRAASAQQMVPLIMADEGTNSLMVRAHKTDFNMIKETAERLDREDVGGGIKIIPVPPTMNVIEMAGMVEQTVNDGERYRVQNTGARPRLISVTYDERSHCLLVSGAAEQFAQVERIVRDLQEIKPAGEPTMRIIPLKNLNADDVERVLEQLMQTKSNGARYRRGRRF